MDSGNHERCKLCNIFRSSSLYTLGQNIYSRDRQIIKDVAELATGSAGSILLKSLAAPVLTRLYTPDEFGYFAVFISVCSILAIVATGRYELGIVISHDEKELSALTVAVTLMAISFSLFVLSATLIIYYFRGGFGYIFPSSLLLLVPAGVLSISIYNIISNVLTFYKKFWEIGYSKLMSTIGMLSLQIGGSFMTFVSPLVPLAAGRPFGDFIFIGYCSSILYRRLGRYVAKVQLSHLVSVLRKHQRFPKFTLPSAFVNKAKTELPEVLLLSLFNPAVAGFYSLTKRVIDRPLSFIGSSVKDVLFRHYSEAYQKEDKKGGPLLFRAILFLAGLSIVPIIVFYVFGDQVISLIFGPDWVGVTPYVMILMPPLFLEFIVKSTGMSMYVMEKQDVVLYWAVTALISTLGSIYLGSWLGGPIVAITIFAISKFILQAVYLSLNLYYSYV